MIIADIEKLSDTNLLTRLKADPVFHIEQIQGVTTLLPYQQNIAMHVAEHERTVVSSSHDLGKSYTSAKIILWFASVFEGAKVITTAPTFNQVKRLLWSEIRAGYKRSKYPLGGEMLTTEWKLADDWFALGFTARADSVDGEGQGAASSFQGFHAPAILVVFDEATGIPEIIWKQLEGLMTSSFVRFLGIGNPTTKSCEFFKCFSNPAYKKIKLSCFDSPNFPANGLHNMSDLVREITRLKELNQDDQYSELLKYAVPNDHLLTVRWVMQMCLKWGLNHPLVVSKCFGEFPDEDENTLIPLGTVQTAQYRIYEPSKGERISIGVDVGRYGSDATVITMMHGVKVVERKKMIKRDTMEVTGEVVRMIKAVVDNVDIHVVIDATGIGSGVVDALHERQNDKTIHHNIEIREVHFGAGPGEHDDLKRQFINLKARMFCLLADDIKSCIVLPGEDIFLEELPTIQYKFDSKGRWQIESKDEYKKRTGRSSPDDADSLALANFGRYDSYGVGNFTDKLNQNKSSTIIKHSRTENLW